MKKILLFAALLGACLLALQGCAKDELDTTGSIAGVITDAETAKALSGATVTLSPTGKSFTTAVDGRYEFRDIAIGNYTVQATKAGYAENQKSVEVMAGETSSLDLPLRSSAPKLEVSTQTLDFGNTATTLTLDIRNTGSAELTWQVSEDIQWLNCVPTSGSTSAGKTSSVIVNVNRTGLSRGTYTQTIAIASNGGSQTVKVTLSVQEETVSVDVKPEALDFGSTTSSLQLTLTNTDTSRSIIAYTLTVSNDWIHLSKAQGQFTYSDVITVSVDRTALSEGTYSGQLTLTIEGKTKVVPVNMTITAKAKPTVTLTEVRDVTYNSSSFLGAIVSVGSARVTHHGFVWATAENPTVDTAQKCDLGDAQTAKDFSYTASNLQPATSYYVRAYAENDEGINYSTQQKFTTPATPEEPTNMVTRGLQAYYTFDDGTADNAYKDANHGFLNGGTYITDTPNGNGKAVILKSEEYVSIGDNPVKGKDNWTISLWVKDFGVGPMFTNNLTFNNIGVPSFGISDDGMFTVKMPSPEIYYASGSCKVMQSLTNYQEGKWTHLTLVGKTVSGTTSQYEGYYYLYVNGRKAGTAVYYGRLTSIGDAMIIAGKSTTYTSTTGYYPYMVQVPDPMKVDNVRVYNVSLTDDEVKQVYDYER